MNIAFFTERECCPTLGGTERTTALVAESLRKLYGHRIFSIYNIPVQGMEYRYEFTNSICIGYATESDPFLANFLKKNKIELVINQGDFYFCESLHRTINKYHLNCKQIFALHFMPGSGEEALISFKETYKIWKKHPYSKEFAKLALYPIYYKFATKRFRNNYRRVEKLSDKIVLLSDRFRKIWSDYAYSGKNTKSSINFAVIPNGLTFDHFADINEIKAKEKRILIVARLDERQKRISKAIDIWNSLSQNVNLQDWCLDIVGDGPDCDFYMNYVRKNNVRRINFYGRQNPADFFIRSSLFMMTSDYEGFGMTLIEASQFGVVPIAFNTYPALSDILTHNENGIIIPPNDYQDYSNWIIRLASDNEFRKNIAVHAVENSKRYSPDIIAAMWHKTIHETLL